MIPYLSYDGATITTVLSDILIVFLLQLLKQLIGLEYYYEVNFQVIFFTVNGIWRIF